MNSVRLNIGGKKFCTSIDTLTGRDPDSMLAVMFSGRHTLDRDEDGYIFIDRDGKHFRHILNWLRDGVISTKLEDSKYCELLKEVEYYQLSGMVDELNALLSKTSEELSSDLTRIDIIKWKQFGEVQQNTVHLNLHGVNLSCIDLSNLNLSGIFFDNATLRNVKFNGAYLDRVSFYRVDAEGVTFDNANLTGCCFIYSNIRETTFVGATLKNANLTSAKLINCSFVRADLESIQLRNAIFKGSNLRDSNLTGVDMGLACFDGADLGI